MSAHGSVREQAGACQSQRVVHGKNTGKSKELGKMAGFIQSGMYRMLSSGTIDEQWSFW